MTLEASTNLCGGTVTNYKHLKLCMVIYLCIIQQNKMAATWILYIAFGLIAIANESLGLGM
jgi:hypothetical protein